MATVQPFATIRLLKDFCPGEPPVTELSDLRAQLASVPDLSGVQVSPDGTSTVVATLPASNQRQKNRLTSLLTKSLRGWKVIEDSSYRLPASL
ncbi:MAG: hypothetical protein JWR80_9948 [Bradyrhizobium sp.]|nr:hypothetical protein [Bradyrhizobium sp.]